MIKITLLFLIALAAFSFAPDDRVFPIPGYPAEFPTPVWSGYLATDNKDRFLHYIFVQSIKGRSNDDPVTLWLNGGPGCSSLLGFLQQIGPYILPDGKDYQYGDNLVKNQYSWYNVSNLLFLQSPAGVGYSYNLNTSFAYNDSITANDNLNALLDFFKKYPQYTKNGFWIAGQSYAGKYIPDLAVLIDKYNLKKPTVPINLKGILVGNGVMNYQNGQLDKSSIQFTINHQFVDPQLIIYWKTSCQTDFESAGCRYFLTRFTDNIVQLNPYSIYDYCYYNDSNINSQNKQNKKVLYKTQQMVLRQHLNKMAKLQGLKPKYGGGAPCLYLNGVYNYFKLNSKSYRAKFQNMDWNGPCAQNITYDIDIAGSMSAYRYLLSRISQYQIALYNGDWDAVVPYVDTIKNLEKLNLIKNSVYSPWFTDNQHSGFNQIWSGILFTIFKGASHQVPQSRRPQAFNYFKNVLNGHSMFKQAQQAIKRQKNK